MQHKNRKGTIVKFKAEELSKKRLKTGRKWSKVFVYYLRDLLGVTGDKMPHLLSIMDETVDVTLQKCIIISGKADDDKIKDVKKWSVLKKKREDDPLFGSKGLFKWSDDYGQKLKLLEDFPGLEAVAYHKGFDTS